MESVFLEDVKKLLFNKIEEARLRIIENHRAAGQRASGRTERSLRTEVEEHSDGDITITLWGRNFFQGLETGRRGGRVPHGFYYIIRQWAVDKGLHFSNDKERNTFSYFVARKIAREGTQLNRKGGRNDIYSNEFKQLVNEINEGLSAILKKEINTIKIN